MRSCGMRSWKTSGSAKFGAPKLTTQPRIPRVDDAGDDTDAVGDEYVTVVDVKFDTFVDVVVVVVDIIVVVVELATPPPPAIVDPDI